MPVNEKKKFVDTKFFKVLESVGPEVLKTLGDIIPGAGIVKKIGEAITSNQKSKAISLEQAEMLRNELLVFEQEELKLLIEDTQDAREMNSRINESENASWLSKNIAPLLAILIISVTMFLYIYCAVLGIYKYRDELREMRDLCLVIIGFYFGSSYSSLKKDKTITDLTSK